MRDDEQFNITFVQKIETYKCLYDYTRSDYKNVNIQEQSWAEIAAQFNEAVPCCKERWRNLRGCFTRHLKQKANTGARYRKPYYLATHMSFILPFTKSRSGAGSASSVKTEKLESTSEPKLDTTTTNLEFTENGQTTEPWDSATEDTLVNEPVHPQPNQNIGIIITSKDNNSLILPTTSIITTTPLSTICTSNNNLENTHLLSTPELLSRKREYDEMNRGATFEIKTEKFELKSESSNESDFYFLKSLLPDIHLMNQSQKRKLRIQFLSIIDNILSENVNQQKSLNIINL